MVNRAGIRRVVIAAIVVLVGVCSLAAQESVALYGGVGIMHSLAFDAGSNPEISGWRWMRPDTRQYVDWVFGPLQTSIVSRSDPYIYLNIDALVTNGLNGGSGWRTHVRLEVYLISDLGVALGLPQPVGRDIFTRTSVLLDNPFLPQVEGNTYGTGYQASAEPIRITTDLIDRYAGEYGSLLLVRIVRKGGTQGEPEHFAVQPGSVWLSFATE
ncbi:hypothetical protein JW848_08725 [Candidatus Bipolaricaulota bacterium]|nr:hypothetical protein [Candidatus Bipolaricaulota bacterium]